jgi:ribose-phosphate pyrophosphokinase
LEVPLVLCHKTRLRANEVSEITVIGDVNNKDVLIIDDMVDTAGTLTKAADVMIKAGAKSVSAMVTHGMLSEPATTNILQSKLKELIITDSIPYNKTCDKIKILSIAELFADTIRRVYNNESISSQYLI